MVQHSGLAGIEAQRRLLLAESDRLREEIAAEAATFKHPLELAGKGWSIFERVRPFWPLVAVAAGFAVTRKGSGLLGILGRITSWVQLGRKVVSLWRDFTPREKETDPPPSRVSPW